MDNKAWEKKPSKASIKDKQKDPRDPLQQHADLLVDIVEIVSSFFFLFLFFVVVFLL